jgi:hypothetical protein
MPKMEIKAYEVFIKSEWYEDGASVLIGVVDGDHPEEAYWGWLDEKVYFYLDPEELANLKVGDVLNDGEDFTIVEIDKDNPHFYEVNYELEEA